VSIINKKNTLSEFKVVVVDNGSKRDDVAALKALPGDQIELVAVEKNHGYAPGVNAGIKYAEAKYSPDYYLLLNNDTAVAPDFLNKLVAASESNDAIGIVGPKVYFYNNPNLIQSIGAKVNMYTGEPSYPGLNKIDIGQYDNVSDVDWVGPCTLVKASVFNKIGYFDESFYVYWEDADFCIRAKKAGYQVRYIPDAKIWHKLWGSYRDSSDLVYYYMARNRIRFLKRNASKCQYSCFVVYLCGYYLWGVTLLLLARRKIKHLKAFWRGILDGFSNKAAFSRYYGSE
jgi:GT2 family glycosyltransferase